MSGRFARLTPTAVKQLALGEIIREHGVIVEKLAGTERWSVGFMHHGCRVHRVLGLSSVGWTRTKCEARIEELKAELRQGTNSLPAGRKLHVRFAEIADWYLAEMDATGGKNMDSKRPQIQRRLKPYFGQCIVDTITEEHIGRYASTKLAEGFSPSTVNRDLSTLSHVFSTAVRRKRLTRPPCRIAKLKEPEGRIVVLTDKQIASLRSAARADVNPYLWLFVEFGLATGMRASEIVRARFDHINWEQGRLYVAKAKAGERHQPLSQHLVRLLRIERDKRDDTDGWIFPAQAKRPDSGRAYAFNEQFRRAVISAGLDPETVTPHVMRHTVITQLVEARVPLPTVQRISGHKTMAMVLRYTHISDPNVDEAMKLLGGKNKK